MFSREMNENILRINCKSVDAFDKNINKFIFVLFNLLVYCNRYYRATLYSRNIPSLRARNKDRLGREERRGRGRGKREKLVRSDISGMNGFTRRGSRAPAF